MQFVQLPLCGLIKPSVYVILPDTYDTQTILIQVDEGNFRLVPNDDRDLDEMVPGAAQDEGSGARHNQQADPVPDVQVGLFFRDLKG